MTRSIVIRRGAKADLAEAHDWYDRQREGLGREFLDEVERCLEVIAKHPEVFAIVLNDARRALIRRFPYSVYFRLTGIEVRILAVIHQRRDPRIWRQRIK